MSFALVVYIRTHAETRAAFMEKLAANAVAARAEPGCLVFDVLVHPEDPDRVMLYEIYENEVAFQQHQATDAFKKYLAEGVPMVASRDRVFMNRIST